MNELHQASDGEKALAVLKDNWVDMIFADINMPVMTGIEMVEKMIEDGLLKRIPVVIVSTEGRATRIEQPKAKGVRAYVRKPFVPEHIKQVVDQIIGEKDGG